MLQWRRRTLTLPVAACVVSLFLSKMVGPALAAAPAAAGVCSAEGRGGGIHLGDGRGRMKFGGKK